MCSMVTAVNNTVLYTWNLRREYILSVPPDKEEMELCEVMNVLISKIAVNILQ